VDSSARWKREYEEVKAQFMKFYWGDGKTGNVLREEWLVPVRKLKMWARTTNSRFYRAHQKRIDAHA